MKKLLFLWFLFSFIITLLANSPVKAQEPVAPNGKFVTVKGLKLYYEETGKGMPLLLMSGFGRTASDWRPYTPELSKYFRVIALDIPGHGRSDYMDTTDVYLHKRAAEYIIGLLDSLHIDSVNVLGASSGGFITLYIATLRPQLTKRIIVIGGQVYYSNTTRECHYVFRRSREKSRCHIERLIKAHGKQKGTLIARQFWNFRKLYGDPSFTPDVLSTIQARALIIHGDKDPIAPVSNAWEMYQNIPKANLWVVPHAGHVPFIEPGNHDDFMRRILEFLRGDWEKK